MDLELHRKQYEFELDQRAQISANTNIPVTAATFLFGGVAVIAMSFNYNVDVASKAFSLVVILAMVGLAVSIYCIFRSMLGYRYHKLPSLSQLQEHRRSLEQWHKDNGSAADAAEKDFDEYLRGRLTEAADHNSQNNINRGIFIHRATFSIATSVVFICAAATILLYQNVTGESVPQEIKVIGDVTVVPGDSQDERE